MKKETYLKYIKYTLSTYNKVNKKELLKKYKICWHITAKLAIIITANVQNKT